MSKWIRFAERMPTEEDWPIATFDMEKDGAIFVFRKGGDFEYLASLYTHWKPIGPLPEREAELEIPDGWSICDDDWDGDEEIHQLSVGLDSEHSLSRMPFVSVDAGCRNECVKAINAAVRALCDYNPSHDTGEIPKGKEE